MESLQEAKKLLQQLVAIIKEKEDRKAYLLSEITRKSLIIQRYSEPDLEDVPPAQRLIVPGDVISLEDTSQTALEWIGTSGLKITLIAGLDRLQSLEMVSFRSGFIRKPSGLEHCKGTLKILELYENRLRTLDGVQHLTLLETLDISYNRLGKIEHQFLMPLTRLTKLYVAENKLTEIDREALKPLVNLTILDLGGNLIRKIEGLETLVNLKELWLGKNKITQINGLGTLQSLTKLSIQSNRLRKMENLENLQNLEELYLSDQGIEEISNLETLQNLVILDLTCNQIKSTSGLPKLSRLADLWLAANQVVEIQEVEYLASVVADTLETVIFERNPVAQLPNYRTRVKEVLPHVTHLDEL